MSRALALALVLALAPVAGCLASPGTGNFTLAPAAIGWPAGANATFELTLSPSLFRKHPDYALDRVYAIEEIRLSEVGFNLFGDYRTKNADDVALQIVTANGSVNETLLNETQPKVTIKLKLPDDLDNSEYRFELKLFKVGWLESEVFRVTRK